ncbi:carbon-nitrogen family hydrolase [Actinosynnema sp. NPDC047251]|uniref:Nitrilase/cyanide hydratase and apolipoprotein N-acyltransferase n=1 Tax=Saccharothrix espanaensis (strain ATCC 51144 / DSM 44229 / JCM 9112 / NBRC 15066 / NRRL 15764) TaxID=1179773 RepID=K0K815_SACES|nr:carbon-nitrogen family hydrolase [Saccharothrix espanaensis]CCH32813.1 Nitrilase/cyanide hydratase and apolipoprotein N-acyltransferase [Saccharothrix espanaensis DSM 44229]
MKIALVQVASPPEETPGARRARVGRLVADARGADLVVLPELWAAGYFGFDGYAEHAEPLHGPTVLAARTWAADLGAHVHAGSFVERDDTGRLFNTAVLVAPDGRIAHTYRKVHVFGHASREAELLTPGDALDVADTALGPIGATTCYDLRFPELWRGLVDRGAETVVVPAAWPAARREHWRLFTSCRAVEQQVLLVACNAVGEQHGVELAGCSRVVDPWGAVLVEAGADEGVTTCEVDRAVVAETRAGFPVLADRRGLSWA